MGPARDAGMPCCPRMTWRAMRQGSHSNLMTGPAWGGSLSLSEAGLIRRTTLKGDAGSGVWRAADT
jgi:hypothetical protein